MDEPFRSGSRPEHRSSCKTLIRVVQRRRQGPITGAKQAKLEEVTHTSTKINWKKPGSCDDFFWRTSTKTNTTDFEDGSKAVSWVVLDGPQGGSNHDPQVG